MNNQGDIWRDIKTTFGSCDFCDEETEVIECAQSSEQVKAGCFIDHKICKDCCYEHFWGETDSIFDYGCGGDCEYPSVPYNIFVNEFAKRYEDFGLYKSKHDDCYLNNKGTMLIGCTDLMHLFMQKELKGKKLNDISSLYKGEKYFFVENENKIYVYEDVRETKELFEKMKLSFKWSSYNITSDNLLHITSGFLWILIKPIRNNEIGMEHEKSHLENLIDDSMKFFNINIYKKLRFNYDELEDDDFEVFCLDILKSTGRFKEVKRIGGSSGDDGIDIIAIEEYDTFEGLKTVTWQVQCKMRKDNIGISELSKEFFQTISNDVNGLLIVTNADMTSPAKRHIDKIQKGQVEKIKFKVGYINKDVLDDYLIKSKELLRKYTNLISVY